MMKRWILFLAILALLCALLLGSVVLARSAGEPDEPCTLYAVEQGVASGGDYRLTTGTWQVGGTASGGGYRLQSPAAGPPHVGSGCCCTYLPDILRSFR